MSVLDRLIGTEPEPVSEPEPDYGSHDMKQSRNQSLGLFCRNCHYQADFIDRARRGELDGLELNYRQRQIRDEPLKCPNRRTA